ncbi:minor capsid protein [Microviridae sp.]|nr:minor capsid protein [Microviridae sp.]
MRGRVGSVVSPSKQRGFWNFVVPAVASVASSLLSKSDGGDGGAAAEQGAQNYVSYLRQEEMNRKNYEAQKEFAQHGIQWKVEDSKAAGLHPLFGAGLGGASFSPSFQVSQNVPLPVAPREQKDYSWLKEVGQLLGNYLGERAKPVQAQAMQQPTMTITEHPGGGRTIVYPIEGLESQVSGRPLDAPMFNTALGEGYIPESKRPDPLSVAHISSPNNAPFWQRFAFGEGFNVLLPKTSEPQEVFEDKPLWFWAMVAKANVKQYGPSWLTHARQQFPSLREVYDGVKQELRTSGILPKGW